MSTKQNLPNNPVTTANFTGEQGKMQELSSKYPRTTTGNLSFTSATSGITYNTATYDGGTYANQGEQGLFLVLQDALTAYIVFAIDFNNKAETADVGDKTSLDTTDKSTLVAAINEINAKGVDLQEAFLMTDKAIAEILMILDIDSKVFSPNLGKFYTNFTNTMDYSLGTVDSFKQTYTGTLSAGATNVVLPSVGGLLDGQEISIQDASNYEDIMVDSIVSTTVSFKTALVNSYTNPIIYRSNNNSTMFGEHAGTTPNPTGSVFGLHFDSSMADFVGSLSPESDTGTYDTTNKVFGVASKNYTGGQYTSYADSSVFNLGSDNWYFKFRVRRNTTSAGQFIFGQCDNATSNASNSIYSYFDSVSNKIRVMVGIGSGFAEVISTTVFTNTTDFYAIAIGRDGNNLRIWVNGTLEASASCTGTINNSTNKFCIGRAGEYASNYLNGKVDEFLLVKGQTLGSSSYTVETTEFGYGTTPLLKNVIRMNITPYENVKYISAWLTKTDLAGFTADGKFSIVAPAADESYSDLTETTTDLGSTNEVQMLGAAVTPNSKVTLKVILNRASTSDNVSFTKLLGGVSA